MRSGYRYEIVADAGRNFDTEFKPEFTQKQMIVAAFFEGKYLNDCREEFPESCLNRGKTGRKVTAKERADSRLCFLGRNGTCRING